MTVDTTPPNVPFVTETTYRVAIGGRIHYVACTQAAEVMAQNWRDPTVPATVEEMIALYQLSQHGADGGTTPTQLRLEANARYGSTGKAVRDAADALAQLRAGAVLTVDGDYGRLPPGYQRWDRAFAASDNRGHAVTVGPIAGGDFSDDPLVWWRDPLGHGDYRGEWIAWRYVLAFSWGPRYTLAFPHGGLGMIPFRIVSVGGGTAQIQQAPTVRLIDPATGQSVIPSAAAYDLAAKLDLEGQSYGGLPRTDAWLVSQGGRPMVLLDSNIVSIGPDVAPGGHSYKITRDDGAVVGTFS